MPYKHVHYTDDNTLDRTPVSRQDQIDHKPNLGVVNVTLVKKSKSTLSDYSYIALLTKLSMPLQDLYA